MVHQLWVFGSNGEGQLGEGIPVADIVDKPTLLPYQSWFRDIKAIKSGDNHTLFQLKDGSVFGIGDDRVAQLGAGPMQGDPLDVISQVTQFRKLESNAVLCAASCTTSAFVSYNEGPRSSLFTYGHGQWGELGRGDLVLASTNDLSELPWMDTYLSGEAIDFAASVWHYIVVMADGSVYGWGKARLGQLGAGLRDKVNEPTKIEDIPFKPAKAICGKDFTYLVSDPLTGEHILLGKDKFNIVSNMPPDIKGWKDIGATWNAIFVLFDDGRLTAWGKENQWKLLPPDLPAIDTIAVGSDHILAVTKDDKIISWGWGKHGNCGDISAIKHELKNDLISGFWNEISISGKIQNIFAGYCTSFVITEVVEDEAKPKGAGKLEMGTEEEP